MGRRLAEAWLVIQRLPCGGDFELAVDLTLVFVPGRRYLPSELLQLLNSCSWGTLSRTNDISGNQLIMVDGSLLADVQLQNAVQNFAFGFGHPAM
jgi:hypothetical protein